MVNAALAWGDVDLHLAFPCGFEDCVSSLINLAWAELDEQSYPVEYAASVLIVVASASGFNPAAYFFKCVTRKSVFFVVLLFILYTYFL